MLEKKVIISLGRQFGSGGQQTGKRLAEILGIDYYDRELIDGEAECRFTSVLIGILLGQCKGPIGDKCTVAHMCLLQVIAWLNANQLSHQAVHHLLIVSRGIENQVTYVSSALLGDHLIAEAVETVNHKKIPFAQVTIKKATGETVASCTALAYRKQAPMEYDALM